MKELQALPGSFTDKLREKIHDQTIHKNKKDINNFNNYNKQKPNVRSPIARSLLITYS